jgi:predicted metal-dependent HD superfamily phosphohydrolase
MVSPERLAALQQGWAKLLARYRIAAVDAYPVFDVLVAAYSAPDRHYHNLEHLAEMFRVASRLTSITDDPSAVQLAIWFHDAVYDARASDNEARSADLAVTLLGPIGVPGSELDRVTRLIHTTAHLADDRPPGDRETAILLDADLAILGAAPERYTRYAGAIRAEYAWVPEPEYRAARTTVLDRFLARPRIFWTDLAYQEGEERARTNMTAERAMLGRIAPSEPGA